MKKDFINKQINLIEKKISILKSEVNTLSTKKSVEEMKLNILQKDLDREKVKVANNPELGFSFAAYYDSNKEKQALIKEIIVQLLEQINNFKQILVRQNIELKKYERLQELELEKEQKLEEANNVKDLDEFGIRKRRDVV